MHACIYMGCDGCANSVHTKMPVLLCTLTREVT